MDTSPNRAEVLTTYARYYIQMQAQNLCRQSGFNSSEKDDLIQELTLRALQKAHLYDPSRGASLDTFFNRVIRSEIQMMRRERKRQKRAEGLLIQSIDMPVGAGDGIKSALSETISEADRHRVTGDGQRTMTTEDREAFDSVIASLPDYLRDAALKLKKRSVLAVAKEMGISRRQLNKDIRQLRERFQLAGFGSEP